MVRPLLTVEHLGLGSVDLCLPSSTNSGVMTSGGTESILMAMLAYREKARSQGILYPEMWAALDMVLVKSKVD